jgi:hypothetical protein
MKFCGKGKRQKAKGQKIITGTVCSAIRIAALLLVVNTQTKKKRLNEIKILFYIIFA